jgi:N-acetylglucosamine-6-phosphate deacetylase
MAVQATQQKDDDSRSSSSQRQQQQQQQQLSDYPRAADPHAVDSSMPSATMAASPRDRITKFTNCRLVKGDVLVEQDLWVSAATGRIVRSQELFYGAKAVPDETIDLGGRIISPGLIDVQMNGAFGFNFSQIPEDPRSYEKSLRQVNKSLVQTGVTSYLPTITSERREVYHHVGRSACSS